MGVLVQVGLHSLEIVQALTFSVPRLSAEDSKVAACSLRVVSLEACRTAGRRVCMRSATCINDGQSQTDTQHCHRCVFPSLSIVQCSAPQCKMNRECSVTVLEQHQVLCQDKCRSTANPMSSSHDVKHNKALFSCQQIQLQCCDFSKLHTCSAASPCQDL